MALFAPKPRLRLSSIRRNKGIAAARCTYHQKIDYYQEIPVHEGRKMMPELKSRRMFLRWEPSAFNLLAAAAKKEGMPYSVYVREATIRAAKETLSLDAKSQAV